MERKRETKHDGTTKMENITQQTASQQLLISIQQMMPVNQYQGQQLYWVPNGCLRVLYRLVYYCRDLFSNLVVLASHAQTSFLEYAG